MRLRSDLWVKESWGALVPYTCPKTQPGPTSPSQVKLPLKPPTSRHRVRCSRHPSIPDTRPQARFLQRPCRPVPREERQGGPTAPWQIQKGGHCFPFLGEDSRQGGLKVVHALCPEASLLACWLRLSLTLSPPSSTVPLPCLTPKPLTDTLYTKKTGYGPTVDATHCREAVVGNREKTASPIAGEDTWKFRQDGQHPGSHGDSSSHPGPH